jgi:hypothetical protein
VNPDVRKMALQFDKFPDIIAFPKKYKVDIKNINIKIPGGNIMNITQKYEIIRSILKREKSPEQVNKETKTPLSTIYHYLRKFKRGSENIEDLADKSHASHSHPKWLTQKDKDKVIQYKLQHPHLSSRQIAKALTDEGILPINYHSVADILDNRGLSTPFLSISHQS